MDENEFLHRLGRIESPTLRLEVSGDPLLRAHAKELLQGVVGLHRVGLARFLALILATAGEVGPTVLDACAEDELVRSLLLLHGLHPRSLEARILTALESVQPLGVSQGIVRLRLHGTGNAAPLLRQALRESIEAAICLGAPDAASVRIDEEFTACALNPRISLPLVGGAR